MTFTTSALSNGLTVATDYSPRHKTVAVQWALGSGSREDAFHGTAHYLEHMFSSSKVARDGAEVMRRLDDICSFGGNNFMTSQDSIMGFAYVKPQYAAEVIGTLGRCITDPAWTPEILERERSAIAEELVGQKSNPFRSCLWAAMACAYPNHPAGRNNLGPQENIEAMSETCLLDYMRNNYHAQRMALCVSGNLRHDDVMELATAAFSGLPRGTPVPAQGRPVFHGGKSVLLTEKTQNQQVMMSFPGPDAVHPRIQATGVMMQMFDNALDITLRDKKLVYTSPAVSCYAGRDYGQIILAATSSSRKSPGILREMHALASAPEKWLTRQAFDRFILKKETTDLQYGGLTSNRVSAMVSNFVTYGKVLSPESILRKNTLVTFDDVNDALQDWNREVFNVTSYGPSRRIPGPDKIMNPSHSKRRQPAHVTATP
jgi:predicted Zn-dependent peptidase